MIDRLSRGASFIGAAALVLMMLLTMLDVVLRWVLNAPIFGATELVQVMLVLCAILGIAHCGSAGQHIVIDLLEGVLAPGIARWTESFIQALSAAIVALMAWTALVEAADSFERSVYSNILRIPEWPLFASVSIGLTLYALVLLKKAAAAWRARVRTGAGEAA